MDLCSVIPAKAGIQVGIMMFRGRVTAWIPAFAGMTILLVIFFSCLNAFQVGVSETESGRKLTPLQKLEAGISTSDQPPSLRHLAAYEYDQALAALDAPTELLFPWLRGYLEGLIRAATPLVRRESKNFVLYLPADQSFLADYALPSLEKTAEVLEKTLGHRPQGKIRVEIYPTKEAFSAASTLDESTLERSGAIGICKFHRLMILTPRALPLGYRWMDALSHEYLHLMINELSSTKAELWLHEGTARYFETAFRTQPPDFLTPHQKTELKKAQAEDRLIPFSRMSPSLVYLKNQEEVSLAFAEVSHAISMLVERHGAKKFSEFLALLRSQTFPEAFKNKFQTTPEGFEKQWQAHLAKQEWELAKGALSDEVQFTRPHDLDLIGADVQGKVALGDRMRMRGLIEAALIEYEKALKEEPDNAVVLLKAARTLLTLKRGEEAKEKLRRAVLKNPNYGTPHIELAALVPPAEAIPLLENANAINPFDPRIHRLWADALTALGRSAEAERERKIADQLTQAAR